MNLNSCRSRSSKFVRTHNESTERPTNIIFFVCFFPPKHCDILFMLLISLNENTTFKIHLKNCTNVYKYIHLVVVLWKTPPGPPDTQKFWIAAQTSFSTETRFSTARLKRVKLVCRPARDGTEKGTACTCSMYVKCHLVKVR